ncbi:imelysin family protein [Halomonas halocynthiae]|uniref:imelysin family protein n=1 Tax=Halomonas halocynthiae TaxID=176290 RepID=UPI00040C0416|nr:imelysin family protein [Halomonas halocynthiae]
MTVTPRPSVLALAISFSLLASNASGATSTDDSSPRAVWYQHITTLYQQLADTTTDLHDETLALCAVDGSANSRTIDSLEQHWLDAYRAWQAVRFVDFGPIELESRAWQLQFWPDDKNLVGTRMAARLHQEAPITSETIATAGVAETGFPALEYLLFDEAMQNPALSRSQPIACDLAEAISAHIQNISAQLVNDWQDFGPHYLATDSYNNATVHGAMQLLDILEDKRLGKPLGMMGSSANAYRAEAWRSDASITLVEASLAGLKDGFMPGLQALFITQGKTDTTSTELLNAFDAQLQHTLEQANAINTGIASGLEDSIAQQQLGSLYLNVAQLRELLNRQIAAELDIVRGFNSSDGD